MKTAILPLFVLLCAAPAPFAGAAAPASDGGGTAVVGFDKLSDFQLDVPDGAYNDKPNVSLLRAKIKAAIPKTVKALDGKKVEIKGFMLPIEEENGGARKFILMRNQITCCFGGANRVNEYVMVTMTGAKPAPFIPSVPVSVRGTLAVGPDFDDGVLNGIYQMNGEEVAP